MDSDSFGELEIEHMLGLNRTSGRIVVTKTGLLGRTYNHEDYINDKIIVHTEKGKILCVPETLELKGFID